jgi:signal transduction histidine kinase
LIVLLACLLIATLGVQYYLNLVTQQDNIELREAQTQALVAGITLGFTSIPLRDKRVQDLVNEQDQPYFDAATKERIKDIIIIDNDWRITDSLSEELLPAFGENDEILYKNIIDIKGLPPLMESARLGDDLQKFPNPLTLDNRDEPDEAHAIPIETSKGRWYVMVILKDDKAEARALAMRPLIVTLGLLLVSSLITLLLVWRFARPIADLSHAAREVATGNLMVRVGHLDRNDEMGMLARNFNEMATELEKKAEIEAQLQQAEKSAVVGRLGSAIAHEIRNPLNYINLTLDHLQSKFSPVDESKKATFEKLTSQLKNEVARINQQISDFLNYSRPADPTLAPIDARQAIEHSLTIAEAEAADKNVTIGVIEHENVPQILGDAEYLRSVFNNLFINAIQAMEKDGGHLGVKISPDDAGDFVNFEITDNGPGIPEANIDKIFEPYFSTKETGTGLGLAIVQKIIEMHNGTIEVASNEREGTRFTVRLPRSEKPE